MHLKDIVPRRRDVKSSWHGSIYSKTAGRRREERKRRPPKIPTIGSGARGLSIVIIYSRLFFFFLSFSLSSQARPQIPFSAPSGNGEEHGWEWLL